jgi:hypothetical protein
MRLINHSKPKRRWLWLLAFVIFGAIVFTVFYLTTLSSQTVDVPESVQKELGASIIMPRKLPSGFSVNEKPSYDAEHKLVLTRFTNKAGAFIALSQQKKPIDVSLKQIDSQETYISAIGTVYVLKGEKGRIQAIIETSDSWVYVDGSESANLNTIKDFISKLKTAS